MSISHQIQISMTPSTVVALRSGGFQLCVCKGVQTTISEGSPVVWYATAALQFNLIVTWTADYRAYTSSGEIVPGGPVVPGSGYDLGLGQTLTVNRGDGSAAVGTGGVPGGITILNQTATPLICGLSQSVMDVSAPVCALPLYGHAIDVIMPVEKVLLMFTSTPVKAGTTIEESFAPGVLVDLRSTYSRSVAFDVNQGWSWGGGPWAMPVSPGTALAPLLVGSSPFLLQHAARTRLEASRLADAVRPAAL